MIRIHYAIWVGMSIVSFIVGAYIPAQADYIRNQTKSEIYMELPMEVLSSIEIDRNRNNP